MTLSIHDYRIYQYLATQSANQKSAYSLTLYTEYQTQDDHKYVDVLFHNVHTHYFIGTMVYAILFDIEQVSLEQVYHDYADLFVQTENNEWPLPYYSIEEATKYLHTHQLQVFRMSSSYKLIDGWVIAERMELRERTQQKTFHKDR